MVLLVPDILKSLELDLGHATLSAFVKRNIEGVVFAEVHMPEELAMYLVRKEWANMDRQDCHNDRHPCR